jgi:RNA polymerase sigma-70 factor (ECF subfamily)
VQQLKPQLREAIILRYWSGQTYREMAEILGCPLPTAQSRVRLAYNHLRNLLSENELSYLEQELAP